MNAHAMKKPGKRLATVLALILLAGGEATWALAAAPTLTAEQARAIGHRIWHNEGLGKVENLTVWNAGEDFPSFGIGHFIWYPAGVNGPFEESFPGLLDRLRAAGHALPPWLADAAHAPWSSREAFLSVRDGAELAGLRRLLQDTVAEQIAYIMERMEKAPGMLDAAASVETRAHIERQFARVAADPRGAYALIDYVNFKGDGASPRERYRGEGWGLLQVLERMDPAAGDVIVEFVAAADFVLTRRVANAERDESRWLPGWRKRLGTYLE
jgi:hypothetical protein